MEFTPIYDNAAETTGIAVGQIIYEILQWMVSSFRNSNCILCEYSRDAKLTVAFCRVGSCSSSEAYELKPLLLLLVCSYRWKELVGDTLFIP